MIASTSSHDHPYGCAFLEPMGMDETHQSVQDRIRRKLRIQQKLRERKEQAAYIPYTPKHQRTDEEWHKFWAIQSYYVMQDRMPPGMRDKPAKPPFKDEEAVI